MDFLWSRLRSRCLRILGNRDRREKYYNNIVNILVMLKRLGMISCEKEKREPHMISYQPFYETLFRRGITEYALIFKHGISANTLHRMKHGKPITTTTLDTLCGILECRVEDILKYIPPENI